MTSTNATSRPVNRLAGSTSPYLLQHQHNPVNWYPWGPEALERAKREDKPIFLSIGYSACHWCHVMERESFENEAVAAVLNEHFVSIKVDREERPDLDDLYMRATQLYNQGQGGWPMSVFLAPDLRPFFAGTYFPPEGRWGRPGFRDLLLMIAKLWKEDRARIDAGAAGLTEALERFAVLEPGDEAVPHERLAQLVAMLSGAFDRIKGGISGGGTNKFPPSMAMDCMLRAHHYSQHAGPGGGAHPQKALLELVETTLDHMAHGGIYDQLAGGIARYSTDVDWLVPHFEKMLYDQALVAGIYLDAFQLTGKPLYGRIAREICEYVIADLQSPRGGYYSTRDADSEGREGKYYVWSRAEVMAALGPRDGEWFCRAYDVTDAGNWEGQNILHLPRPLDAVAKDLKIDEPTLTQSLAASRAKLLTLRAKRIPPHLDDKILASWNGLMVATMARAHRVLDEPRFGESAARAADFVLKTMRKEGRLLRTCRNDVAHTPAFLDDHAFMIEALLNLYETTFDARGLDEAVALNEQVLKRFSDPKAGGFFFTPDDGEIVLMRSKDTHDGAIPSGNSVQLMNLLRLSVILHRSDLAEQADRLMKAFGPKLEQNPGAAERMIAAVDFHHRRPREIVIVADRPGPAVDALLRTVWQTYVPNKVVVGVFGDPAALAKRIPLLADRKMIEGRPTAYVCENFTCKQPTTDPETLRRQLGP